jgi:hypothetical protein
MNFECLWSCCWQIFIFNIWQHYRVISSLSVSCDQSAGLTEWHNVAPKWDTVVPKWDTVARKCDIVAPKCVIVAPK